MKETKCTKNVLLVVYVRYSISSKEGICSNNISISEKELALEFQLF